MKLHLLKEFIILAESLNFTKAAEKLNTTQPVLSRHIKEMEEYFGDKLFTRDTHNVKLTATGILVFSEVKKIIKQFDNSISTIHAFTGKTKQKLSIAYLGEAFNHILRETIEKFRESNATINLAYQDCELDEVLNHLKNNEYDIGLIIRPNIIDKFEDFDILPLFTDNIYAIVNKSHPLANHQKISLKELANYPMIREDPKYVSYSEICSSNFFLNKNLNLTIHKEYKNFRTCLFNLELDNKSFFIFPEHRLHLLTENTVGIEIEDDCYYVMEAIWNKDNRNPNLRKFIKELKNNVE
ncbi:LysR family transcriptional regulator [Mannheimia massilioguelmaensis]|uniref:LysR family transcriptional regulator n=1 Tax=Mannheimia massilioguelmaensis TaxID=1604354 RepID=UPI0005CA92F4|nr:LysR family transcriptional regulator [Mannheimia massilioguelmaensis]